MICLALALAVPFSQAALLPDVGPAAERWVGALRHVQLLEVTHDATTFVTAHESTQARGGVLALYRVSSGADVAGAMHVLGKPFRHIQVSGSTLPCSTYERPPVWRVLRDARGWCAVVHESTPKRLALVRFEDGSRVELGAEALALLDARVVGDRVQVLALTRSGIVLNDLEEGRFTTRAIVNGAPLGSAATFVRGLARRSPLHGGSSSDSRWTMSSLER